MDRGEKKGRWLEGQVASGSLGVDEALWQMFEWCQKEGSGGGSVRRLVLLSVMWPFCG